MIRGGLHGDTLTDPASRAADTVDAADIDTTELVTRLRRRERWLLALAAVRSELLAGAGAADVLQLIAERSALLTEADAAVVLLGDPAHGLRMAAAAGVDTVMPDDEADRLGGAFAGAIREAAGVHTPDDLPVPESPTLARMIADSPSLLLAPVPAGVVDCGTVICLRQQGREPFEPDQQPELVGLAEQASIALDVADRAEQERLVELVAERERIARDLHDHVIQRLFAVGLALQNFGARADGSAVSEQMDRAVGEIDEAIAELRASIFDLRSTSADANGRLRQRLQRIVSESRGSAIAVRLRINGAVGTLLTPQVAEHAEAVVRESVSNAIRHSRGSRVVVTVTVTDQLEIEVTDDGRGIDPAAPQSGLANLSERAAVCGGSMTVEPNAGPDGGAGTTLRWQAPLPG